MTFPSSFQRYLSVPESAALGRVPDELLSQLGLIRESCAADDLTDMIETLAGIGIACLYGTHTAGSWISYIPDPTSTFIDSIGRIPCHPGRTNYCSLFTIGGVMSGPALSVGCIGSGYVKALSTSCREIGEEATVALAEYIQTGASEPMDMSTIDAAVHRYVPENAGDGMQNLAGEFLCHVEECCLNRKYSA